MESYYLFDLNNKNLEDECERINKLNDIILSENKCYSFDATNYFLNNNIVSKKNKIIKANIYIKKKNNTDEIMECPICYNNINFITIKRLKCNHKLCLYCYDKLSDRCNKDEISLRCPLCRDENN